MGRKGHLNVSTRPLTARRGNGSVTGLRTRIAARAGGDAAESLLPVVVPTRAAAAEAIAAHGVVDVAALDVTTTIQPAPPQSPQLHSIARIGFLLKLAATVAQH
jgi:hypothetical protein